MCTCPVYSIQVSEYRVSVLQKDVHEVYSVPYSCCAAFPKLVIFAVIKLSLVGLLSAADVSSSHVFYVFPEEYLAMNTFRRPLELCL